MTPVSFTGFPPAAFDFYDDLAANNSKSWWTAHKATYDDVVRQPMVDLLDELSRGVRARPRLPSLPRRAVREGQDAVQGPPGRLRRGRGRDRLLRPGRPRPG